MSHAIVEATLQRPPVAGVHGTQTEKVVSFSFKHNSLFNILKLINVVFHISPPDVVVDELAPEGE